MAELVTGALVGIAVTELYMVAKDAVVKMVWCKKYCKALARDLEPLLPIFREIYSHLEFPARECEQYALLDFKSELEQGTSLINSCIQLDGWHPIQRLRYGRAIVKLRELILKRLQVMPVFNTLLLQKVAACQQDVCKQQHEIRELCNLLMATVTSPDKAALMDWIRQANSPSTPKNQADTAHPIHELYIDKFLIGLTDSINQVKSLLFAANDSKIVTILGGMGGIGKTTLAISICKDPQVQEFFQNRVHFFTVSQSPNILGLLSTIWKTVVGCDMPVFQSEEDASRQMKGRLLGMPYKQLIVLDDVWSKAHLEYLSFEGKYCRTLITTRQAAILETHKSSIFNLGLLNEDDAQSLFCFWAFGQDSIPEWADEELVKEVISECKGLPLALKVIGGSISSAARLHAKWVDARDKLRAAEPLGEYHEDALQKRLQTSIDVLDPRLQECFQDLGAFPEDSNSSVDTLLEIWVHVRGMDRTEAVLALVELSSRCLLDFDIYVLSDHLDMHKLEDGSAMSFNFSQHDVMRDLALHLCTQGRVPSQRTRLLMPQRESNIPKSWLLADDQPHAAQIVCIDTGAMTEEDWPPMLAFPFAEALLLRFDGDAYHLPPFVRSMCKLKALFIFSSKSRRVTGSLEGLGQLKSIGMDNVDLITSPVMLPKLETLRLTLLPMSGGSGSSSMLENQTLPFRVLSVSEPSESCPALHFRELLCLSEQLGNFTNLVYLGFKECLLLDKLPASLCNLHHLEVLVIDRSSRIENLSPNIGELSAMKTMYFFNCIALRVLPESLGNLSSLEKLNLIKCKRLRRLPKTFPRLEALKELNMSVCHSLEGLPENFGLLTALENFTLSYCRLKCLPQNFGLLSKLKQLDLSFCGMLKFLPESFGKLSLKRLSVEDCGSLQELPKSFEELSYLEYLSLKNCQNLRHLPQRFGELSCLKYLSLENCCSVEHLPEDVGKLQRLKELNLKGAKMLEALPDSFVELCCLEVLQMGDCEGINQLPERFGNLRKLRRWEMLGVGLKSLPASIGAGGLVGLEIVVCSQSLMPLWKARRGDCHPLPQDG